MDSPLPPDPYNALGVTNKADAEAIKKAYRKLALKLHPDKCQDESQKASRTDEFTKIQQAYDLIGDDEKRNRYDAMVRLAELRRQNMEMRNSSGGRQDVRTTAYDVRTAAPRDATYTARGAPRTAAYEERRPKYYDDYEATRGSTRKANEQDEYVHVKRPSPREKEKVRVTVDPREEEHRRETRRREAERTTKYARDEYEERRRKEDREYEEVKRKTEAAYEGYSMEDRLREAQRHIHTQSRRPAVYRANSSREIPVAEVRRSAAPPKEKERTRESRRTSPNKDERRRMAENLDPNERRVPPLSTQVSSPPVMESMPPPRPQRSFTTQTDVDPKKKKAAAEPIPGPPPLDRATTQPVETMAANSTRRKESSKSRHVDEVYSASASPSAYSKYSYAEPAAPPRVDPNYRTVLREPTLPRRSSSSPTREDARPTSKTAAKMAGLDPRSSVKKTTQYAYPPVERGTPRAADPERIRRERVNERDRDYRYTEKPRTEYFGENGAGTIDPRYNQPKAYRNEEINFAPRYAPEDVKYSSSSSRRDRAGRDDNFAKPGLNRATTYVY